MISERLISAVMTRENKRLLTLTPAPRPHLPRPKSDKTYMLYVHIPFCERLCPYCSFNRYPYDEQLATRYFNDLRVEMRLVAEQGYRFGSLYFGGGTPTINLPELCETIDLARELFDIKEVSCETNPNHLIEPVLNKLAGRVNRMSVGVQSFDDGLLRQMDRLEKYGDGATILERIKDANDAFDVLNVDMIFNFPSQTAEMLRTDCSTIKESGCNQATFYPLMASPVVEEQLAKTVGTVSYAREAAYYDLICNELGVTGTSTPHFARSTAWTFSRIAESTSAPSVPTLADAPHPTAHMIDEYIIDYDEYVGIGSGAMSYLEGKLLVNTFSLAEYGERIAQNLPGVTAQSIFSRKDLMRYRFLMDFFSGALDRTAFMRDFGVRIEAGLPTEMTFMRSIGAFETYDRSRITLSQKGYYLLVAMMRQFFIGVNNVRDEARMALSSDEKEVLFGSG
ncbi:MAG: coproporphyrinogen III oxidase family protein [Coriobacteriia bacterium]|nr:coproporphyrinogen III oxidase family protein [Coriobacteriia bacterium]